MASPTFNGFKIFDSIKADGSEFSEGVLFLPEFSIIRQRLHFNGESGDRYLQHGAPDRQWVYQGIISAPTGNQLKAIFDALDSAIEDGQAGKYRLLTDSFGNLFTKAQVHHRAVQNYHVAANGFVALGVVITGIVQGMVHDGGV